ncbi:hypothetical protein SEA_RANA_47 [Streptomyces phage Rana]|uniref:Uncharacterized protein n=1 Tax=Streptomyces phage Lorelei TaxID=1873996 RepID=A0A1C9LWJ1_9CAUD|nr:hypothetical protein KGH01_gp47 [Streptomyces phage Lorelei]AOQ26943.1 hypothetical protein SEA_LORELEI_47 [Streptomyces phage Lorelei]AWN07265.1 hypothetical protein SEA_RANA_47 [Streptomyces phage Rana]AWN07341.1 hypothetical protein SEA_NABI_47 [Streptomyces phage Nabi]
MTSPIPEGQTHYMDDVNRMYYWFNDEDQQVYSRPYNEAEVKDIPVRQMLGALRGEAVEAITLNDQWIADNEAFLLVDAPTPEQLLAQVRALTVQASYQSGTAKRVIRVLAQITGVTV